jgi:hypothetical protein
METNTVSQFILESKGLQRIRKAYFIRTLIFFSCFSLIAIFSDVSKSTINGVPMSIKDERLMNAIVMLIVTVIVIFFQQLKIVRMYKGFTIRLNNDMLERSNARNERVLLYFVDVAKIVKISSCDFLIYSSKKPVQFIPNQITNRDALETLLHERVPAFYKAPDTFYNRHYITVLLITLLLIFSDLVFKNKILVSAISLLLLFQLSFDLKKRIKVHKDLALRNGDKTMIITIIILIITVVTICIRKVFLA